jgi:hypothetical protein
VEVVGWGLICGIAAIVVVPLAREYLDFRRTWGVSRMGAVGITALLVPSFGVGLALAHPLSARPGLQWLATVVATLAVYSLAVRGVEEVVEASSAGAPERPR